jgi:protein-S-isoprenylcysteine O-methyltransferase Ste14
VLLAALGLAVLGASVGHVIGVIALFTVLSVKASGEEAMLEEIHEGYEAYRRTSGRLVPRIFSRK